MALREFWLPPWSDLIELESSVPAVHPQMYSVLATDILEFSLHDTHSRKYLCFLKSEKWASWVCLWKCRGLSITLEDGGQKQARCMYIGVYNILACLD